MVMGMVMPTVLKSIVTLTTKCDFLFGIGEVRSEDYFLLFH